MTTVKGYINNSPLNYEEAPALAEVFAPISHVSVKSTFDPFELTFKVLVKNKSLREFDNRVMFDVNVYLFAKDHRANKAFDQIFCGVSTLRLSFSMKDIVSINRFKDNFDEIGQHVVDLLLREADANEFKQVLNLFIMDNVRKHHMRPTFLKMYFVSFTIASQSCNVEYPYNQNNRLVYSEIEKYLIDKSFGEAVLELKPKKARMM